MKETRPYTETTPFFKAVLELQDILDRLEELDVDRDINWRKQMLKAQALKLTLVRAA